MRAAQGDEAPALDTLLAALRPWLVAFFARRIAKDTAEDLAQAALIRITRALRQIDPERADRYVSTVARNLLRTEYQRRARDRSRSAPAELGEAVESPVSLDRQTEHEELIRAVHRASVATLPPELREIVLGLLRGLSPSEIAAELGINPVTIRTRLLRARALLRRELWPYLDRGARAVEGGARRADPTG